MTGKNLSSHVWTKLIADFRLSTSVVDKLDEPGPSDFEHVSPQLIELISVARNENPAVRMVVSVLKYVARINWRAI